MAAAQCASSMMSCNLTFLSQAGAGHVHARCIDYVSTDASFPRVILSPGSSQPRALVFAWSLLGCIIVVAS